MDWLHIFLGIVGVYFIALLIMKSRRRRCYSNTDLTGKTAIVTGASRGIGYEVALDFARRNAKVILANRPGPDSVNAVRTIQEQTGNKQVRHKPLDLSSLQSVRTFSEEIHKEETRLDILVNNSGILSLTKHIKTVDGLDTMMATNHFGPFLLTNLLLDLLKKSAPSRIIVTSSLMHRFGTIHFDDMNAEKIFIPATIYSNTKLANVLFARELSHRLEGTGVTANSLHPGTVRTGLLTRFPIFLQPFISLGKILIMRSPADGAQTTIYAAVAKEVEGVTGKYFSECEEQTPSLTSQDDAVARKLWEASEKITGLI